MTDGNITGTAPLIKKRTAADQSWREKPAHKNIEKATNLSG